MQILETSDLKLTGSEQQYNGNSFIIIRFDTRIRTLQKFD